LSAVIKAAEDELSRREVRQEEVRLFALKHAWANDVRLPLREGEVIVPGIATTLRRLMVISEQTTSQPREILSQAQAEGGGGSSPLVKRVPGVPNEQPADMTTGEAGGQTGPTPAPEEYKYGTPTHMRSQLSPQIRPSIEADMRRNAVLVRDSGARMKLYEDLIRQLDVPVRLVEIQASIVDVDADLSFEWGLDASLSFQDEHNEGGVHVLTPPQSVAAGTIGNAGAIEASWLLLNDHLRFLTVVRALEGKGQARILSRPSLITFANLEAELRDDQTYNVRVTGERVAQLVSVTAGVQLRVSANIIDPPAGQEEAPPGIQLLVHIEDGSFDTTTVDGLPVVRTSALNTQAVVGHGQSLLVGGYIKDASELNRRSIPVISKIPVVGSLFRSTGRSHRLMQRMFLLTPTMVELDAAMGLDPFESAKRLQAEERMFNVLERQAKIKGVSNKSLPRNDLTEKPPKHKNKPLKKKALESRVRQNQTPVEVVPAEDAPGPRADAKKAYPRNFSFRKSSKS
ncbi:MAG: type III secretion system outer membrane ring subunit SctC, partial [Candidatus Hydrogenedentes bacterium]|nr:type III secretion system outer membrane ring subunit SctC [Candidatus Hydrogenedentota bacterium]